MTLRELEQVSGVTISFSEGSLAANDTCYSTDLEEVPGASLLVTRASTAVDLMDGQIQRVSAYEPGLETVSGIHVGSTESEVRETYANFELEESLHDYNEDGINLRLIPNDVADAGFGLRFEINNGVVAAMHGGDSEVIQWMEGCS